MAADAIRTILRTDTQRVTLVGIAPATNIALALMTEPALAERIEQIVLMTGAWGEGNATPAAEFNALNDPEALAVVLACGRPVVLATLELTAQALCTPARLATLRAAGAGRCTAHAVRHPGDGAARATLCRHRRGTARSLRYRLADPPRPVHHTRLRRHRRSWARTEPWPHGHRSLATHRRTAQCHPAGDARSAKASFRCSANASRACRNPNLKRDASCRR